MSLPVVPSDLSEALRPLRRGFSADFAFNGTERGEADGGFVEQRQIRSAYFNLNLSCSFHVTAYQLDVFRGWWATELRHGSGSFLWDYVMHEGSIIKESRIVGGAYKIASLVGKSDYVIECDIECREVSV